MRAAGLSSIQAGLDDLPADASRHNRYNRYVGHQAEHDRGNLALAASCSPKPFSEREAASVGNEPQRLLLETTVAGGLGCSP